MVDSIEFPADGYKKRDGITAKCSGSCGQGCGGNCGSCGCGIPVRIKRISNKTK